MISKSSAAISVEKSSSSGQPSKSALSHSISSSSSSPTLSTFDEKKGKRTATIEKSTTPTTLSSASSLSSSCPSKTHPSSYSYSTINPPTPVPPVPPQRYKAHKGDIITLSLKLTPENDYIPEPLFDTTGIITFILGWGSYLPAIHSLLLDHQMSAGDSISKISIDAGWGERNPNLVARIPRAAAEKFKLNYNSIQVGMELTLNQLDNMRVVVTKVTDTYIEVDANPPLAGASYECNFTVLKVEPPTLYWEYHNHDDTRPVMSQEIHDENEVDENNVHTKCDEACCCCHCHHDHVSDITAAGATTTTTTTASSSDETVSPPNHIQTNNNDNDNTASATATATATSHNDTVESKYQAASFALGCFWGAELAFMRIPGVVGTKVGYTQGTISNPTYDEVCTGLTKHTEAVLMVYDPAVVTYEQLVRVALDRIKETTAVGNGYHRINTVGGKGIHDDDDDVRNTQYRHGIYYHTDEQRKVACEMLRHMGGDHNGFGLFDVEVRRATVFYNAEDYHQQYLLKGGQSAKKGCTETIRCFG